MTGPSIPASPVALSPAGTSPARIRPSAAWYSGAAVLLIAAATAIGIAVVGFLGLNRQIDAFPRVSVPGRATVVVSEPGRYLLYIEGRGYGTPLAGPVSTLRMSVTSPAGHQVRVVPVRGRTQSYGFGRHRGQSFASITLRQAGRYVFSVRQASGPAATDVAIGHGIGRLLARVAIAAVAAVALVLAGLTTAVVIGLRRGRSRRRLHAQRAVSQPSLP